ncbi:uncharacterized protein [Parasteatoda tepidariorum]|uniref:uncharacterized protein n=1 Tax=Parasteatoda tepidariorum TaxID=114398 RepID=UPI00077F9CA3|nr:uncharacterized protein LOC107456229 [Parasteatoda tepidariorum]
MSFQFRDGHCARSDDLHRHILRSHLAYLNQEETPSKLQHRHNLENLISEYLSTVSHRAKFTFAEVFNILNNSIENNFDFSAYKAASAFEALEKYATNLISHPWRKEYKTIKLYSGFYKHSVESQLLGGSSMFHLLGYQFTEKGVLFLDEPVDPDKVARVALDCLIAYVECQLMLQICERLKSFKCTWQEINQVRQDYVCGIDETVRILHQLKRNVVEQQKQERWLREQENDSLSDRPFLKPEPSNYQKTGILVDVSNTWPSTSSFPSYNHSSVILQPTVVNESRTAKTNKGILHTHSKLPSWSEGVSSQITDYPSRSYVSKFEEMHGDGYAGHSFDSHLQPNYFLGKCSNSDSRFTNSDLTPESWSDSWDALQTPSSGQSRHDTYLSSGHDRTGYTTLVPNVKETPQFGHIYPSHPIVPLGLPAYSVPHEFGVHPRQCPCRMCSTKQLSPLSHKYPLSRDADDHDFEPYVRSDSTEDPSEICSSLLKMSVESPSVKTKHFPLTSPFSPYQTNSNPSNNVVLRSNGGNKPQQDNCKRGSYYDNVPSPFDIDLNNSFGQSLPPKCDYQLNGSTSPSVTHPTSTRNQVTTTTTSDSSSLHSKPVLKKSFSNGVPCPEQIQSGAHASTSSDSKCTKSNQAGSVKDSKNCKKWSCSSCTFYNPSDLSICNMCGRSKNPGPEIAPLVSGGRECPQCTLVNKKDTENCIACGSSLKDSPTYI